MHYLLLCIRQKVNINFMKITDIRIQHIKAPTTKLRAFATVILDDSLVIRDLRIFESVKGDFVSMPSVKDQNGEWREIITIISTELKEQINNYVLRAYHDELLQPGKNN